LPPVFDRAGAAEVSDGLCMWSGRDPIGEH
jgi:hypothetical protein